MGNYLISKNIEADNRKPAYKIMGKLGVNRKWNLNRVED